MAILSGLEIHRMRKIGGIQINPYAKKQLNPASYDLRLGGEYAVYKEGVLDAKKENEVLRYTIDDEGLLLEPGKLYLMHTVERIMTKSFVPVLDGKSSIGRLGIMTHVTAGYGDPGFDGQYTLEVVAVRPVRVYAGMRFCQMRFHQIAGGVWSYEKEGHYVGEASMGPVESMSWKQFQED